MGQMSRWNKESVVKSRIRCATYSLACVSIVLMLLLAYPEANRSGAKTPARGPIVSPASGLGGIPDDKKETIFTPAPAGLKTWHVGRSWYNDRWNCGRVYSPREAAVPAGQVLVGYIN